MLVFALLAAQGLDAPIDMHPTVRSEIRRGASAASTCGRGGNVLDTLAFSICIENLSDANRQRLSQGYEPFEIGLFYEGAEMVRITASVTHKPADADHADGLRKVYATLRNRQHLTDAEVMKAVRGD